MAFDKAGTICWWPLIFKSFLLHPTTLLAIWYGFLDNSYSPNSQQDRKPVRQRHWLVKSGLGAC